MIKKIEEEYRVPQKVVSRRQKKGEEDIAEIARNLLMRKHKFKVDYIDA